MEEEHKLEWSKAQEITFSIDLVKAAKQQLSFLQAVDNFGCLYEGPALERAIYRYKNCWLPLLAKNIKSLISEGPLVVPLDCEWIWHCHRLNPVQYKNDCKEIYGKVLGTSNVLSTVEGASSEKTELLWNRIYVNEPYNFDIAKNKLTEVTNEPYTKSQRNIEYDLVAAVKRQSSFFSKVAKMMDYSDCFLVEALSKYKAFHHLIQIIRERKLECSCVPTLDIDLIWHTHQLYPIAYGKDMKAIHGRVVDHNDRDSEPKKMEYQFLKTKELWEESYGKMYHVNNIVVPRSKQGTLETSSCSSYMCEVGVDSGANWSSCSSYMCEVGVDSGANASEANSLGLKCFITCSLI